MPSLRGPGPNRKLTPKQKLFIQHYLILLNATQAAIKAGYSKRNAGRIGNQLLDKTRVVEALAQVIDKRLANNEVTGNRVIQEYAQAAFAKIEGPPTYHDKQAALDSLAKYLKLWAEGSGTPVQVNILVKYDAGKKTLEGEERGATEQGTRCVIQG